MALEETDDFFGGEGAGLLREDLQEMDSEFLAPHASPTKGDGHLSDSDSSSTDTSTDSESDEPASSVSEDTAFDKRPIDIKEGKTVKTATCGCSFNSGEAAVQR